MIAGADWRALQKDLPQVIFAFADPFALQFRPADNGHGGADLAGDGLGEQRLAGAGRTPEDHAARDQLLDRLDLRLVGQLFLAGQHVEDLRPQPFLDLGIAADVLVEADVGHFEGAAQRRLTQLSIGSRGLAG